MKHEPKIITEMWAWICTEEDGGEGIPAIETKMGVMPLIGADEDRIVSLRQFAKKVAKEHMLPIKLVKFTHMEIVETLDVQSS